MSPPPHPVGIGVVKCGDWCGKVCGLKLVTNFYTSRTNVQYTSCNLYCINVGVRAEPSHNLPEYEKQVTMTNTKTNIDEHRRG